MLHDLGITESAERVYRALLSASHPTVPEIAAYLCRSSRSVWRSVAELETSGLVSRLPGRPARLLAARPETAIDLLVAQRQDELERLKASARVLAADLYTDQRQPDELIEIVVGTDAVGARYAQLLSHCTSELLVLNRPPYVTAADDSEKYITTLLRANVQVRAIYSPESLEHPDALTAARRAIVNGEHSTVHPEVPMKLAITDREVALLPLGLDDMASGALVIRKCALLDALLMLFDSMWDQSVPFFAEGSDESRSNDPALLTLLVAGMKDTAIARQLGISPRTVARRVSQLLQDLGARTRFQAGFLTRRRGWSAPPRTPHRPQDS